MTSANAVTPLGEMAASEGDTGLDSAFVMNPGVESRLFLLEDSNHIVTLPRVLQPLMGNTDWLPSQVHRSLQNAETQIFMSGDLTKHELASIHLLIGQNELKESFSRVLHQKLLSSNPNDIYPFLSYLRLVTKALRKLPVIGANIWHAVSGDVSELYPVGLVFTWHGFPKCCHNFQTLDSVFGPTSSENRTLFHILSASGRIVGQLSDSAGFPHVLLMPGIYYQVTSVLKADHKTTVIHVKEIPSPADNDWSIDTQYPLAVIDSAIHPYWTRVLANTANSRVVAKSLRVLDIALSTGDVALLTACVRGLQQMPKLDCSDSEKQKLLSTIQNVLKTYTAFRVLQTYGCAVLKLIAQNLDPFDYPDSEGVSLVLRAMQNHVQVDKLILHGLEYFTFCRHDSEDVILCQKLVDVVLSSMKNHPKIKGIQRAGCVLINSLSKATHCASLIRECDGFSVILNAILIHRGDLESSEICWRALLGLSDKNNNRKACSTQDKHVRKCVDFWCLVKEGLAVFSKRTPVQVEGLHAIWSHIRAWAELETAYDPDYLQLVIYALRHHSQNAQVVMCSCGILSELTKQPSETHLAVSDGVIACVLSAMKNHFNEASVQEYGCKVLRTVAVNGFRPYQHDSQRVASSHTELDVVSESLPDYRLKILESGGMGIVLSAMKTHSQHVGVQRQGCLAIRTLAVSATNLVETKDVEEIGVVLEALSKHMDSVNVVAAALRAVVILIINQLNRRTMVDGGGLTTTLTVLRSFPNSVKIQEEGLEIIDNLANDENLAHQLLRKGFVKEVILSIERHPRNARILTSCCGLLAKICSASLEKVDTVDMLPTVALVERGGFDAIVRIMTEFRLDAALQIQCCRALQALAVGPVNTSMLPEPVGVTSVIEVLKNHPANTALLTEACRTLVKLVEFRDKDEGPVTTETIDQVFCAMSTHPEAMELQMEGLRALRAVMRKYAFRVSYVNNSGVIVPIVSAMRLFPTEYSLQILCVQVLNDLLSFERNGSTPWHQLVALFVSRDRPLWDDFCSLGGLEALLETMRMHVTSRSLVMYGGNVLLCNTDNRVPIHLKKPVLDLCEQIKSRYSSDDERLHLMFNMLNHIVLKQALS